MNRAGVPFPSDYARDPGIEGWVVRNGHKVRELTFNGLLQRGRVDWRKRERDMNTALTIVKADNGSEESRLRLNDELLGLNMYRADIHPHLTARITLPPLTVTQFRDGSLQNESNGYTRIMAVLAGIATPTTGPMTFDITVPAPSYIQTLTGTQPSAYVSYSHRREQQLLTLELTPDPSTRRDAETHPFLIPLTYVDSFRVDAKETAPITSGISLESFELDQLEARAQQVISRQ